MNYVKADGFDLAIIGIDQINEKLIYNKTKMIKILLKQGFSEIDAIEFLEFNVWNAYVGINTPIYVDIMNISEIQKL